MLGSWRWGVLAVPPQMTKWRTERTSYWGRTSRRPAPPKFGAGPHIGRTESEGADGAAWAVLALAIFFNSPRIAR
jgi:hypothetical protein